MDTALEGYRLPIQSIRMNLRITRKRSRDEITKEQYDKMREDLENYSTLLLISKNWS
jgi:hypothetical protein